MKINIRAKINKRAANKRIEKIENNAIESGNLAVRELGKLGQNFAKTIVYYDTGFTYKSIKRRTLKGPQGEYVKLFIDPYIRPVDGTHRHSAGNYSNFSLVRWSHTSPLASFHIKSGDPQFMYTTRQYLESIKGEKVKGYFKTLKT